MFLADYVAVSRRIGENAAVLGEMTTNEVPTEPLVIIPLGATEQHGPHLPLDTDTRIAVAWAHRVAEQLHSEDRRVIVAPALPYGASGEHQGFDGTMSVGNETLTSIVVELGRSMRSWAGGLIFLSGHAGNVAALREAERTLVAEGDSMVALVPRLAGSDAHAGHTETSILLSLSPEVVRLDRAEPGCTDPIEDILPALVANGVIGVSPNGVLGDPTGASKQIGAHLLDRLVELAVTTIEERLFV